MRHLTMVVKNMRPATHHKWVLHLDLFSGRHRKATLVPGYQAWKDLHGKR